MQYVVLGYDAKDADALNRRMSVRENHLQLAIENHNKGILLFAAGLLNDQDQMIGSNMIMEFESKTDLDIYLKNEPYIKGNVWEKVKVFPAKVAPFCLK
jgi:uncharacterized protein